MDKDKIQERLRKIKALAEQSIGGEKEGAKELYQKLIAKYEIDESLIEEEKVERRYIRYDNDLDKKLIVQIFYMVTGSTTYWVKTDKRRRLIGVDCTDFELNEILFYYRFYSDYLKEQLDIFLNAFIMANDLYPDENARCKENKTDKDEKDISPKNMDKFIKAYSMASNIDKKTPMKQIEQKE